MFFRGFLSKREKVVDRIGPGAVKKAFFRLAEVTHKITHLRVVVEVIRFEGSLDRSVFNHLNGVFAGARRRNEVYAHIRRWRSQTLLSDIGLRHVPFNIFWLHAKLTLQDSLKPNR